MTIPRIQRTLPNWCSFRQGVIWLFMLGAQLGCVKHRNKSLIYFTKDWSQENSLRVIFYRFMLPWCQVIIYL